MCLFYSFKARGTCGKVKKVFSNGDMRVKTAGFPPFTYNPACLTHVETVEDDASNAFCKKGDKFFIRGDVSEEEMKKCQEDSGGWNDMMSEVNIINTL